PVETPVPTFHGTDKLAHMAIYGGFAAIVLWNVEALSSRFWLPLFVSIVIVAVQGAVDEITQPLTGRLCDIYDWAADLAGAIVAITLLRAFRKPRG
ncbi:MAG TPA: VanZ family protein, partial [Pirellulales bacterium]|nr:VanZ family protein [Pirellulales bacterium]